jgi:phage tail sheath protein FI
VVREIVAAINDRIRYVNSHTISGPPTTAAVLDVEETVQRWRRERHEPTRPTGSERVDDA